MNRNMLDKTAVMEVEEPAPAAASESAINAVDTLPDGTNGAAEEYAKHDLRSQLNVDVNFKSTSDNKFNLRECAAFIGPGFLVCVAYIDPGNVEADLQAGAKYGYMLLYILLWSTVMGVILQFLSVKLALVTGKDLSRACRDEYPTRVRIPLWLLTEVAIVASDIPEVIGTAFALNLLFGLPLWAGVLITGVDTLLFLAIQMFGIRYLEGFIGSLVGIMGVAFVIQMFQAGVEAGPLFFGLFVPRVNSMGALYLAISLLGAVVMPHNLYLHSALALTRSLPKNDVGAIKKAMRYNLFESSFAIGISLVINIAIVSVAASEFYTIEDPEERENVQEHPLQYGPKLLEGLLGRSAEILFAISLLASGQSSTMTGTYAGQFVMEGFLNIKINPALRNFVTRSVAIVPSLVASLVAGEAGSEALIVFSSVVLAFQLPFAVIPLIKLTNAGQVMGPFHNPRYLRYIAGVITAIVIGANMTLLIVLAVTAGVINSSVGGVFAGIGICLGAFLYFGSLIWLMRRHVSQKLSDGVTIPAITSVTFRQNELLLRNDSIEGSPEEQL